MLNLDELVAHWGYGVIALVVILGNVGVPVPEETVLALGGYLAWQGKLRLSVVLVVGIVSAAAGDNLGYWLGRRHGQEAIERYARRWLGRSDLVERTRRFVARRGTIAVVVARFVPGLRCIAGPLAGATGMPLRRFVVANLLGAAIYVPLAIAAGWAVRAGRPDRASAPHRR
jgi:membrane protein DedA with SNARE-associated domain